MRDGPLPGAQTWSLRNDRFHVFEKYGAPFIVTLTVAVTLNVSRVLLVTQVPVVEITDSGFVIVTVASPVTAAKAGFGRDVVISNRLLASNIVRESTEIREAPSILTETLSFGMSNSTI